MSHRPFLENYAHHWIRSSLADAKLLVHTGSGDFAATAVVTFNKHIKPHLKPGAVVLDYGCGTGRLTRAMAPYASWIYAMDVAPSMLNFARDYCAKFKDRINFSEIDQSQLMMPDACLDAVVAWDVLHFLETSDMLRMLQEFGRVLRSDGVLIASLAVIPGPARGTAKLRSHTFVQFRKMLQQAGLVYKEEQMLADGSYAFVIKKRKGKATAPVKLIFPIHGRFDDHTGYGNLTTNLTLQLLKQFPQYDYQVKPVVTEYQRTPKPGVERIRFTDQLPGDWTLLIYTLYTQFTHVVPLDPRKATVYYTMWESTQVADYMMERLKQAELILSPNSWFASLLSAWGLRVPIKIVPLGLDIREFPKRPQNFDQPFTIGQAGRLSSGGIRKGSDLVIAAFLKAFPKEKDVRLKIKAFPEDEVDGLKDPRIEIVREHLSNSQLAEWYRSINVLASGSGCEGWGLHQQEAMCTGRPVIGVNFGGVTEFWNPTNGYAVDFNLTPGVGPYENLGHYAGPKLDSMVEQMRRAYADRDELIAKSELSHQAGRVFTRANMASKLVEVLREDGYIS